MHLNFFSIENMMQIRSDDSYINYKFNFEKFVISIQILFKYFDSDFFKI